MTKHKISRKDLYKTNNIRSKVANNYESSSSSISINNYDSSLSSVID